MDKLSELLGQLAIKLGTTVEYLWKVLINQAYITGIVNIILYILLVVSGIVIYKFHRYFDRENDCGRSIYGDSYGDIQIVMVIIATLWAICLLAGIINIGETVTCFVNPEYWALHEVLKVIGG